MTTIAWMEWGPTGISWQLQERRRICSVEGCYTILSRFNDESTCSIHGGIVRRAW